MIKEAVILAAGKGKRMRKSLRNKKLKKIPKPLIKLKGKPIICYNIESLIKAGIEKIIVVINKRHRKLFQKSLKNYNKIVFCFQDKPLGTANALYCAKNFLSEELFLVVMGDDIIVDDFKKILKINKPTVFGFEVSDVSKFGCIIVKNGFVEKIEEKKFFGKGIANTGTYIMHKKFFEIYKKIKPNKNNGEYYLTDAVELLNKEGIKFRFRKVKLWLPINDFNELKIAEKVIQAATF